MNLDIVPEHLPVIAARLGISSGDLMTMIGQNLPAACPAPPGLDDISALIPECFGVQASLFFPSTECLATQGTDGACALPEVGTAYSVMDVLDGTEVIIEGSPLMAFVE
ncbi:hypothetical protein [Nocardia nepalensis]|uniref:hypothetical protein n=1 Tax=Nocardia nepalensis TaxID=3375448 RepID=UPI003B682346